jgi:hypothetical protein
MKTVYLNMKSCNGIETVDEFSPEQGQDRKTFRAHVREMESNYREAGIPVYQSRRATRDWMNR